MTRAEKLAQLRGALDGIYTMVEPWIPPDPPAPRRLSVPSYFFPGAKWDQLTALPAAKLGLCVINPASGPGSGVSLPYVAQVTKAQAVGLKVFCYVPAGYGNRAAALVDGDIERAFNFYPAINGIFFDQAQDDGGATDLPFFIARAAKVRAMKPGALVVMNSGAAAPEAYAAIADVIVTFEGAPASYRTRKAVPWEATVPREKFWHIIHSCPQTALDEMLALAAARPVGHLYITNDTGANPYDTLPVYVDELCSKLPA